MGKVDYTFAHTSESIYTNKHLKLITMDNNTLIAAIHHSINLRGFDSTVGPFARAGKRTRRTSHFTRNAYKMIFNRSMIWAAKNP